jgi:hypothetical protein
MLSALWTDAGLEEEYQNYGYLYQKTILDKISQSTSTAQILLLTADLRQAMEPLMATFGMEPDFECSECSGHCCPDCITKWKRMESSEERKEEQGREAREEKEKEVAGKEKEEGGEEKVEWEECKEKSSALVVQSERDVMRKRKTKKGKKGKKGKWATVWASM